MHSQFDDSILCGICSDVILTPARLACKHEFCCYCIRTIRYKLNTKNITCPLCRRLEPPAGMDQQRGREVIEHILIHREDIRVLYGDATTINHYDKNKTDSKKFFLLLREDRLHGDIIWGEGTQHSSYLEEVGRLEGTVKILPNKSIEFNQIKCFYSNSPYQDWKGVLEHKGGGRYEAVKAVYYWHGWGRESSGDLLISLMELQHGKTLAQQGIA